MVMFAISSVIKQCLVKLKKKRQNLQGESAIQGQGGANGAVHEQKPFSHNIVVIALELLLNSMFSSYVSGKMFCAVER